MYTIRLLIYGQSGEICVEETRDTLGWNWSHSEDLKSNGLKDGEIVCYAEIIPQFQLFAKIKKTIQTVTNKVPKAWVAGIMYKGIDNVFYDMLLFFCLIFLDFISSDNSLQTKQDYKMS